MSVGIRATFAVMGLVFLGFALGVGADHAWLAYRLHADAGQHSHEDSFHALMMSLELTDGQRDSIEGIFARHHATVEERLAALHPVLQSSMDSARHEIEALLTPHQLVLFEEWTETAPPRVLPVTTPVISH